MKYFITEKPYCLVVFIEMYNLKTICQIADFIENKYPESVFEVTHNFKSKQGSIILKKDSDDAIEEIKNLLNE